MELIYPLLFLPRLFLIAHSLDKGQSKTLWGHFNFKENFNTTFPQVAYIFNF